MKFFLWLIGYFFFAAGQVRTVVTKGAGLKQIIVQPCGVPGTDDCPYSAKQTATMTTGGGGATVITDIGELLFMPSAANVTVELQDPAGTWTVVLPASTTAGHQIFSDGSNLRFKSTDTSTNRTGTYYVIQ